MTLTYRIIRSEHFEINIVLTCLDNLVNALERKTWKPDFDLLFLILDFIESFPATFHHPKEEDYLFKAVRRRSPEAGPVLDQLCDEHVQGLDLIDGLKASLEAYLESPAARDWFRDSALGYVDHERQHMLKEEREILPLALQVLSRDDWREIDAAFERNDHPLFGPTRQESFDKLFSLILRQAPNSIAFEPTEMKVA
jgi:hemerythrin-like domain-containing protein